MKNLIIILLMLVSSLCWSQTDLKSAKFKVIQSKNDVEKVDRLLELGQIWFQENPDSADYYYKLANKIAIKINYYKGRFVFYECYVDYLGFKSKNKEALIKSIEYYNLAVKVNDKKNIARSLNVIGFSYNYLGEFEKAIQYYQKSIELYNKLNLPQYVAKVNNLIAISFYSSNNFEKSEEYCNLVIKQAKKLKDKRLEADGYNILVGCLMSSKRILAAEEPCKKAIFLYNELKAEQDKNALFIDLSKIQFEQKKVDLALKTISNAIFTLEKIKNDYYLVNAYSYKAKYLIYKNDLKSANQYISKSMVLAKHSEMLLHFPMIYEIMIELKKAEKDFKSALFYKDILQIHRDSVSSLELKKQMQNLDVRFQTKQKETLLKLQNSQIKQKTTQNILLLVSLLSIALFLIFGLMIYKNRQRIYKQTIEVLIKQQRLTATESILKGQEEERGRLARDLHDGLGGLLSGIKLNLNNMNGNVILSEQNANVFQRAIGQLDEAIVEMRRVAHSMMPEALLRFGLVDAVRDFSENISQTKKLKVSFQAVGISQERFPENVEITLYRIVQELINNALKHAEATDLYLQLAKTDDLLTLTAEDNGKGFDTHTLKEGIGLKNIKNRVDYLGGKLDIRAEIGKGTSILIEVYV